MPCPGGAAACAHCRMPQLILAARPAMSQRQGAVSDDETFIKKKLSFYCSYLPFSMLLTDLHGDNTFY